VQDERVTNDPIVLTTPELREVTRFAAACAASVLDIFELARPGDGRPRAAVEAACAFAAGEKRGAVLRDTAWAALRAAGEAGTTSAGEAARAAMSAAGAAYLHPLAKATQVRHILGAAAYAARAAELAAGDDRSEGARRIAGARLLATPTVIDVLRRYPNAPPGGGRVGELLRVLDGMLRDPSAVGS